MPQHPETEDEAEPLKKLTPNGVLESLASSKLKCHSFNDFKDKLRELWTVGTYRNDNVKTWETYEDIPAKDARLLINIIKHDYNMPNKHKIIWCLIILGVIALNCVLAAKYLV